jgi:hypothetical protein
MAELFVNKVAESGLVTLDLEALGGKFEWMVFDLKPFLFMELILKEKDFREALGVHDWQQYQGKTECFGTVAKLCLLVAILIQAVWQTFI